VSFTESHNELLRHPLADFLSLGDIHKKRWASAHLGSIYNTFNLK